MRTTTPETVRGIIYVNGSKIITPTYQLNNVRHKGDPRLKSDSKAGET